MPKLYDAFDRAPQKSPMVDLLTSKVPSYSEQHRAKCELESVAALKKVLAFSHKRNKEKKSG